MASKVALTLTIVAFGCFTISTGHLNLYMNQTETQRLLGKCEFGHLLPPSDAGLGVGAPRHPPSTTPGGNLGG